jgi:hypothetical protein
MTNRAKKIFLLSTVVIPFIIYGTVYYAPIIRNAPFKAKEFVSVEYKWGLGDSLVNSYNSATGAYQYLNDQDSLVIKHVNLNARDKKFLDSNADEQGFWNLPTVVANNETDIKNKKLLRYFIKFNYQKKSKEVTYFANFNGTPRMKSAAAQMQKIIEQTIIEAEEREVK